MTDYRITRRGRIAVVTAVLGVVVLILGIGAYGASRVFGGSGSSSTKDYVGDGSGSVRITIASGDTLSVIGAILQRAGVVASIGAFTTAANGDTRSEDIQPGTYALHLHMSGEAALTLLLDPASRVHTGFTIPEGASITTQDPARNIAVIINKETGIPLDQLKAAIAAPATIGLPSYADGNVQGFLFPATYDVTPGTTATEVITMMTARFAQAASDTGLVAGAAAEKLTPLQVITLASIIQGESASTADAPKVARVFFNRIAAGLPLGSEFTVNYAGGSTTSPFNTYTHTGIPPAPLDSPGQAAISAVLHPATGSYEYFITLPKEGDVFVNTQSQFFALQQQCRDEGGCKD
jgi:UPF0755 protein